jgi:hypothetical protein
MYLEDFVIGKLVGHRKNLEGSCKIQYFYFVKNEDAQLFHGIWSKPEIEKNSMENRMGKGFCSPFLMVQPAVAGWDSLSSGTSVSPGSPASAGLTRLPQVSPGVIRSLTRGGGSFR